LIGTAKLNDLNPESYRRDVLSRVAYLLPWNLSAKNHNVPAS